MSAAISVLLPVFMVIALGFLIRRIGYLDDSIWRVVDQICWYVLFPVLIIKTLATAELSEIPVTGLGTMLVIVLSLVIALLFLLKPLLQKFLNLSNPGFTSFFQGTSRWNGFVALAFIQILYGAKGVAIGAFCFSIMVPILQVTNVIVLTVYGENEAKNSIGSMLKSLSKNPMLVSVLIGISLNFSGVTLLPPIYVAMEMISGSALGLSLLAVGSALKPSFQSGILVILSSALKLLVFPFLVLSVSYYMGISGLALEVAIICGAAPTAGSAYIMAKQMGGDADMVASIITFQTFVSIVSLPLILTYLIG